MFGSLGFTELMLIFGIALIVFGPRKLPEIGKSVGKALGEFKRATNDMKLTLEEEVRLEDEKKEIQEALASADKPGSPTPTL